MTNFELIGGAIIAEGIMTKEELDTYMAAHFGSLPPYHTYKRWQELGYQVKKGSKADFKCVIWKPRRNNNKHDEESNEEVDHDGFFQKVSFFFGIAQVEKAGA